MLPSEEFLRVKEGTDAGWPYYYYDQMQGKKLLNPEYGGDGIKEGNGLDYEQPLIGFPGHWAPNDLLFYEGDQFPERYKHGAFIAFHGSTIRAPYPQSGYFIGFVPFKNGKPSGPWEVFADGFAQVDTIYNTSDAKYRPMGLAMGPDGSLYISESEEGKIWRVLFKGNRDQFGTPELETMENHKMLPHIKTPDEVLDDLTPGMVAAGQKLYNIHCGACHLADGKGDGTRFPPLVGSEWVMGDKKELIKIVLEGKQGAITVKGEEFLGVMPPLNYLTDVQIEQILTFVRNQFGDQSSAVNANEVQSVRYVLRRESSQEL
jgi:mono/diheme cytochrome c family protein